MNVRMTNAGQRRNPAKHEDCSTIWVNVKSYRRQHVQAAKLWEEHRPLILFFSIAHM